MSNVDRNVAVGAWRSPRLLAIFVALASPIAIPALAQNVAPRSPIRDVTPPGMTKAFRSDDPGGPFSSNPVKRLEKVRVLPDGSISADGSVIRLEALAIPDRKRLCRSDDGTRWPCGSMAFVALRNLIASGSTTCEMDEKNNLTGNCKVAGVDASISMLETGWAELREPASAAHRRAATSAKSSLVGIWSKKAPSSLSGN